METQVRTPQEVFHQPQRIVVPLFQRPYVWSEESQWEPLWNDIMRVALRSYERPQENQFPHFLGAVVLQQVQNPTGQMQERTVIDGQQRLTTLQIFLDSLRAELVRAGSLLAAKRTEALVKNPEEYCTNPEDRFKVWPTNRDRPAFNAVMSASPPVDYDALGYRGHRMVEAHKYFSGQIRDWLYGAGSENVDARGIALENTVRKLLQMVVIDLTVDENAQEIFETLNARGAQLTAADLIKNFVFQRLQTSANIESVYQSHWADFETGFWETEISAGRLRYPRSAVFFNHWLAARTGEEIVAREVFDRFKRYADHEAKVPMPALLGQIHNSAEVYRNFITRSSSLTGPIDRLSLFGYRTSVLESEVIKPLILFLYDPEQPRIAEQQLRKALDVVESWMVRRMLVRATTKSYTQIVAELIAFLKNERREAAGDSIEGFLLDQTSGSRYWPDDAEVREELTGLQAYRRIGRGRLRMILEAIEDHMRGWRTDKDGAGGERVARGKLAIEHVMPRKWQANWPVHGDGAADERDSLIHTLGNLTLLTIKLNSKASNAPWAGSEGKRKILEDNDVFMLNRDILKSALTLPPTFIQADLESGGSVRG